MFPVITLVLAGFMSISLGLGVACGTPRFTLDRLYAPMGSSLPTHATDINDSGVVLVNNWRSSSSSAWRTYVWKDGETQFLTTGYGLRINNSGQVSGYSGTASSASGWFWDGSYKINLEEIDGGQYWNRPHALNNNGDLYGYSLAEITPDGDWRRAVGWNQSGQLFELGIDASGFSGSQATAVNDLGQVVGYYEDRSPSQAKHQAWVWENGAVRNLPVDPNATQPRTVANGINNSGQIVGWHYDTQNDVSVGWAALWEGDTLTFLSPPPGRSYSTANDISDRGYIVGLSSRVTSPGFIATLWTPEGQGFVLEDLVDDLYGWKLDKALAINNRNQIVGLATDPEGEQRGFLLTPVPEPSTLLLALLTSFLPIHRFHWVRCSLRGV